MRLDNIFNCTPTCQIGHVVKNINCKLVHFMSRFQHWNDNFDFMSRYYRVQKQFANTSLSVGTYTLAA